jgi:DNA-directed RNA polymerase specialized sigma24 family protein
VREKVLRRLRNGAHLEREGSDFALRQGRDRRRPALMRLAKSQVTALDLPLRRDGDIWRLAEGPSESREIAEVWQVGDDGWERRSVNTAESPIAFLLRHADRDGLPFLQKRHVAALESLRDDHARGYAQAGLSSNWDRFGAGGRGGVRGGDDASVARLHARDRCHRALACLDANLRIVIARVCLEGVTLGVIEKALRLPRRTAKDKVREGLDRLARFYGY